MGIQNAGDWITYSRRAYGGEIRATARRNEPVPSSFLWGSLPRPATETEVEWELEHRREEPNPSTQPSKAPEWITYYARGYRGEFCATTRSDEPVPNGYLGTTMLRIATQAEIEREIRRRDEQSAPSDPTPTDRSPKGSSESN